MALADIFVNKKQNAGSPDFSSASEQGSGSGGLADGLLDFFSRGADVYATVKNAGKGNANPSVSQSAAAQSGIGGGNTLLYVGAGLAVVVVLYFALRK